MGRSLFEVTLVLLCAGATVPAQSWQPRKAPPVAGVVLEEEQDFSWFPHEQRPPYVSALVQEDGPEDTADTIYAGNAVFTVHDEPEVPAALKRAARFDGAFTPGYFIVHFETPIQEQHRRFLDRVCGQCVREDGTPLSRWYVPNNAVVVWIDSQNVRDALDRFDPVDYVWRYEPAYKLDPTIGRSTLRSLDRVDRSLYRLNLDIMPGHDMDMVELELRGLGVSVLGVVDLQGAQTYDLRFIVVDALPHQVTRIAFIEGVRNVQEASDGLTIYDLSGGGKLQNRNLAADNGSASPVVTAANFPLWITHNLQGQGQLIGVVDTNLDWNNVGVSGCNFGYPDTAIDNWGFALPNLSRVLLGSVGPGGVNLKVPRADNLGGAVLGSNLTNEHGAGVAGAALGDFYGNNDTKWWEHDVDLWESWAPSNFSGLLGPGIAHEAQLYFTPVDDANGNFRWEFIGEFETNMATTLGNMAAAGVCTTNHSVGLAESSNTYTTTSVTHDTAAFDHPQMLQCVAAGNSGAGSNRLTSQAVVKNVLSVGASDDVLRPENRVTFSSTGPRFDGAIKPDLMAPGDDTFPRDGGVASLLILPDSNGATAASCEYQYTAGTSFSSPTMAGAGALVHQYFQEGRYLGSVPETDPSAALIKAMLVNAGHRLTGSNLGDGTYPNMYQGWGEPNLSHVLDFGGARALIVSDVGSAGGFTSSSSTPQTLTFNVNGSGERLRVTLVWTDEPGSTGQGKKLINDLDLLVTQPGGTTYRGNVFNTSAGTSISGGSADTLNNVENVILASPVTGAWTATVDPGAGNYSVPQGYALVVTGDVSEGVGGNPPVANFVGSPTSGTAPLNVNFTDLSSGTVTTWSWNFGDSGTSNLQHPSHVYANAGTYTVTLTVTGPGGSDGETKTNYITVNSPPGGGGLYYLTFDTATTVPGLGTVQDEDVVTFNPATSQWAWYFDGSDVGLGSTDINALHVLSTGSLVLSFDSSTFSVPGLTGGPNGTTVEDSDLVVFTFITSGANTSGSFSFAFDGSDVGLTTSNEDIDGIYEFPGGGIAISCIGSVGVSGVSSGQDEDVLLFLPTALGSTTAGTWSMYFDGSDVGFAVNSSHDVDAVTFEDGVDMLFSTLGSWAAAGGSGADEDVGRFTGTFGSATSGSASRELDLSALGISTAEDVDGVCFVSN